MDFLDDSDKERSRGELLLFDVVSFLGDSNGDCCCNAFSSAESELDMPKLILLLVSSSALVFDCNEFVDRNSEEDEKGEEDLEKPNKGRTPPSADKSSISCRTSSVVIPVKESKLNTAESLLKV